MTVIPSDVLYHPGELLEEELQARGMTQRDLARLMGRPYQSVSEIVHQRRGISVETALQLERALGIDADTWLGLQLRYDLKRARRQAH